jgi:hypothetical protein
VALRRRVHSDKLWALRGVERQEGAVIAADVEDQIVAAQRHKLEQPTDDSLEMLHHRTVERRPVAVVVTVHLTGVVGMPQLDEPAVTTVPLVDTLDELKRTAGQHVVPVLWEHTGQTMLAKIEDRDQVLVRADPAPGDLTDHRSTS